MTDNHPGYTLSLGFKALLTLRGIKHLTIKALQPSTERQCGTSGDREGRLSAAAV